MAELVGSVLMILGGALSLIAGIGVVRLPSVLSRLHAAAKPASLGLALVALGAGVAAGSWPLVATAVLVVVFQFLTAPVAGHLLGRSVNEAALPVPPPRGGKVRERETRRWPIAVETVIVWVILWRDPSWANLLSGTVLGVAFALLAPARFAPAYTRPVAAVRTVLHYLWSLGQANVRMARHVLMTPTDQLREALVVCDLATRSESVAFFDANATSFAPGTLTLEISADAPYRMLVHAVGQSDDDVKAEVAELEESASKVYE